jgi:EmrB/QacA subfamily drug resistance transporter
VVSVDAAPPGGVRDTWRESGAARQAWRVFFVTSLGVLLTGINVSSLEVALPVVTRHLHAGPTAASWLLLSYLLVTTVLIMVFGRLADMIGRRRLYLVGLGLFTAASFGCGAAPNVGFALSMRVLQAIGAAAVMANTTALLTDVFPGARLAPALGLNVTVAAVSLMIGPVAGGVLAQAFGWRWVFWAAVPFGALDLVWAGFVLRPHPKDGVPREPFDTAGAVLSAVAIGGLVLALSEGGANGWGTWPVFAGAVAFAVAAPAFVVVQKRRAFPMVDVGLFGDRERTLAYLVTFLQAVARFSVVLLVALYVQAASGADSARAGIDVLPASAGMLIASPVAGRLARHYSARILSTAGLAVAAAALLVLAVRLEPGTSDLELALLLGVIGIGSGLFMTPNTAAIMGSVAPGRRGIANGVRSMLQSTGTVVSTALSLAVVTSPLSHADKAAAYAGTLSSIRSADLGGFTAAYHRMLLLLAIVSGVAALASLARNPPPVAPLGPESND